MYVPNYVPEPVEVPDNVTQRPYLVRLAYVRRVEILHFASLLFVGMIAYSPVPSLPLWPAVVALAVCVLALCGVRVWLRRGRSEATVSALLLPLLLTLLGLVVKALVVQGWPMWTMIVGPAFALMYTVVCGRDFSFLGQYLLALIASSVTIAALADAAPFTRPAAWFALAANAAYLSYFVYDLASLLARRRLGEELAAVVDLYRDVLNVFGYLVRIVHHWKRHRIWVAR